MEQHKISRLLRTIRILQILSFVAQCAMLAAAGFLAWYLARNIEQQYLWSPPLFLRLGIGASLFLLLSRAVAWMIARNSIKNAVEVDRLYNLKDRITTYIELKDTAHPFLTPMIHETSSKIDSVSALRSSGARQAMILPAIVLSLFALGILTLPYLPVPESVHAKKQEMKRIGEKGKELEQFARELEKQKIVLPELKQLTNELKELSQQLQKPSFDKAEVLKKLNEVQDKLNRAHAATREKLTQELKRSWQEASQSERNEPGLSQAEKAAMEQLAREFEGALEGKEPFTGKETQKLDPGQFSNNDLKKLKEALKNYQDQKSKSDQMRAQMEEALDQTRKTTTGGKSTYTADSRLKDRDVEKGKGGVEDGPGTTNQDTGPSKFDTTKKGKEEYVEDRTRADYERRYQGERNEAGKDPLFLQNQWDEKGNPQYTRVRNFGLQNDATDKNIPGQQIAKQNQEESAVRKERIPASHQQIVKEYFEAIEE